MADLYQEWLKTWGPDPQGSLRYTKLEAKGFGYCEHCTCWRGKKGQEHCFTFTAPPDMCLYFKVMPEDKRGLHMKQKSKNNKENKS